MSLKKKSFTGALWYFGSTSFSQAMSFAVFLYLAKLLDVEAFGLVTFTFLMVEFSSLFLDVGVTQNLVRRESWDDDFASSAHWMLIIISIIICLVMLIIIAPLLYFFYNNLAAYIFVALSFVPIVNAYRMAHVAKLHREFKNKQVAAIDSLGVLIFGSTSLVFAMYDYGAWSLVFGRVAQSVIGAISISLISDFKVLYKLNSEDVKENIKFGLPLFYIAFLGFMSAKTLNLLVGFILGPVAFAIVSLSRRLFQVIIDFSLKSANRILTATFPRTSGEQFYDTYYRVIRIMAFLVIPAYMGLGSVSDPLIVMLIGEKWSDAIQLMQIIAFGIFTPVIGYFLPTLLISKGLTDKAFRLKLIVLTNMVGTPLCTVYWGAEAVIISTLIMSFVFIFIQFFYVSRFLDLDLKKALGAVIPFYLASVLMYVTVRMSLMYYEVSNLFQVFLAIIFGALVYFFCLLIFFRKDLFIVVKELQTLRT